MGQRSSNYTSMAGISSILGCLKNGINSRVYSVNYLTIDLNSRVNSVGYLASYIVTIIWAQHANQDRRISKELQCISYTSKGQGEKTG